MGAAAVAARIRLPLDARRDRALSCGLAFDALGGPLVAVCGLVGGSGASTLAMCLARQAAFESAAPVLLTESDDRGAGLASLTGHATPHSLPDLARRVAEGDVPTQPFVETEPGLRLVAAEPRRLAEPRPEQLAPLLADARAAHGLVVVDCGRAGISAAVLDAATHIVWTVAATRTAAARARALMGSNALPAPGLRPEVLVAVATARRGSVRPLREVAALRCERLVLMPYVDELARDAIGEPPAAVARVLTGLARVLRSGQ